MQKKRFLTLALALAIMLSACSTPSSSSSSTGTSTSGGTSVSTANTTDESGVNPEGVFPIVNEKIELEVMVPSQANVEDMETNTFTQYYEELTNIHINWNVLAADGYEEKVNISLATNTMPDIYLDCNITQTQQAVYGTQGAFYAMNDAIDKYGANIDTLFTDIPTLESVLTMGDGNIYALPYCSDTVHTTAPYKLWMNMNWLDNVGAEVPTTVDEFQNVLTLFKEQDANGNGDATDEIPLLSYNGGYNSTLMSGYLFNPFVYAPFNTKFVYIENGEIQVSYDQEGWKEALMWMNELYDEGLFYNQSFTMSLDMAKQASKSEDGSHAVGAVTVSSPVNLYGAATEDWSPYVAIAPLEGPYGQYSSYIPYSSIDATHFVIAATCEYPEAAFRWGAELYDREIATMSQFGVEGEGWVKVEPGVGDIPADSVDMNTGAPVEAQIFADGIMWGDLQNYAWRSAAPKPSGDTLRYEQYNEGTYETSSSYRLALDTQNNMIPYAIPTEMILPPMVYTQEQSTQLTNYETIIYTYVEEMVARFVTGDATFDEWDAYIAELENKGLSELKAIYQEAYNAKYAS